MCHKKNNDLLIRQSSSEIVKFAEDRVRPDSECMSYVRVYVLVERFK